MPALVIGGQAVGVYLRTSSRRNKDGSTVRYLSIAHNERRPGGPSVAKVCQAPGLMEARFSRSDGCRNGGAVAVPGLVLGRWHESELAV